MLRRSLFFIIFFLIMIYPSKVMADATYTLSASRAISAVAALPGGAGDAAYRSSERILRGQAEVNIDTSELQAFLRSIGSEYGFILSDIDLEEWLYPDRESGEKGQADDAGFMRRIIRFILSELLANASLMGQLLVLAVLSAILTNLGRGFMDESISSLAGTLCYFILMLIGINSFRIAASIGANAVDQMAAFMYALMPTVFALLVSLGGTASAVLMHPMVYMVISSFIFIVKEVVLPLALIGTVMTVMSRMSDRFQISKMAALFASMSGIIVKLAFVVFIGVASIRGLAAAVGDGIAIRAGKFAVANFIPVFGGMLSESYEVIAGTSLALKSSIGMLGAFVLLIISIYPAIKILAILLMFKIAGAMIQPLGEIRFSDTMNDLENSLSVILLAVAATGIAFFSAMAIVIGIGSVNMMLR